MTINEEGAKIVRLIFHKFVNEGKGTHVIARELREEGIEPMRVKEWQNTVILRVIRNEKYCGDLVQKKTYTPDFLSHEKKYNRGQEEFVIIKDHHEPIVSRELFEEANRILDERSLSQEGKAKHSNRYPFSGKIKCGHCGASYVARYKTRKDGSKYKAWRCQEAAKHGSPHTDKAGNQIGCTGASIRNEDATHIMFLVTKELKLRQTKITKNLTSIIESIIAMDTTGTDIEKLKTQIATIEDKRTKLIDIYMSGDISKDEFSAARSKCDAEIAELQSVIDSIDKQQAMIRQQQELVQEIRDAINEIVCGVEYDDEFYKHILDKMVVNDKDNIDVYLNLLPMKWSYTVAKASKKALAPERNISGASVPIVAKIYGGYAAYPGIICFLGAALYCIQLYCDFSGGIDLMMGISRLFGISMQENFCRPYFSVSLSDFWRRWHISLGEWMKDYLFYPLALSKPFGRLAQFCRRHMPLDAAKCIVPSLCTFLVFLAVGVWQGPGMANIAYGLWNGFWMSLAMFRAPIRKHLRLSPEDPKKGALVWGVVRTNLLVIIGRYFSNASSLRSALGMLKQTVLHFGVTRVHAALFTELGFSLSVLWKVVPMLGVVFAVSFAAERGTDVARWLCERKWLVQFLILFAALLTVVLFVYGNAGYTPIAYVYENV